ncbi:N-acetylhexosaminidase [Trametopsis cervina]|nr:N-acetylhexosaminidase [Trametopsis cervina]
MPRFYQGGSTPLALANTFGIDVKISNVPNDLTEAVTRTLSYLKTDQLERLVVGRGAADVARVKNAKQLKSLELHLALGAAKARSISTEAIAPLGSRREEYTLTIPTTGAPAILSANSTLGLFRGLTTFEQLWYTAENISYTLEAPMDIIDSPAFPYRGFMLDTSRNFFPVSDIKRTLDAMSWAKMNQFHWHPSDSQSFPLGVPGFMEVAEKGAYSLSSIYSPEDIQGIVSYAAARGIDVIGEIDMPGHTAAIHYSHPEHVACFDKSPWSTFASEPIAGQLRIAASSTRNFTANLLEATARLFSSSLFSTGGDELNEPCYDQDPQTQQILNSTGQILDDVLGTFVDDIHGVLDNLGKTQMVKSDLVLNHNVTFSNDTVVVVWSSSQVAVEIAARNMRMVLAPSDYFYLDCGAGEWVGGDPAGNSWCDPFKTWQRTYTYDPFANLTESQQSLVLGGQQPLWTEQSGPENLDSIVWPRAASSAEVFWTGPTLQDGSPRNVSSALPRLHDHRFRMVQRGIKAIPLQPLWCALRPGACDLTA